ncbi:Hypothetical protein CINCED_3A001670 [Cinara cedri]|uniref:DNA/RNA non-specific endonuclease/pyrophosphatase/phosphodiesterase domain-containing protein n=1 Tax=Cinara cedri TaxID=506608 RepID=A0A5E4M529_9HEMI|nr:Hypothetical protein CINCED_3A001670 [Cinara cedri]
MNGVLGIFFSAFLIRARFLHVVKQPIGIGCDIHINSEISHKQPLVLKEIQGNEKGYAFDEPDVEDDMFFKSGESVLLACPGSGFHDSNNTELRVNCVQLRGFRDEINKEERSFEQFKCNRLPESKLKREGQCAGNKSAFAIGFEVREAFVKIIDLCFDEDTNSALYAVHKLTPNITGSQKDGYRISFKEGGLFPSFSANVAYNRDHQKYMFSKIISRSVANQYINNYAFFARGHLAPRADFIFDSQQAATFYYANVGPQWQSFNNGNWEKLESAIRKFVINKQLELIVYTGTYDILENLVRRKE